MKQFKLPERRRHANLRKFIDSSLEPEKGILIKMARMLGPDKLGELDSALAPINEGRGGKPVGQTEKQKEQLELFKTRLAALGAIPEYVEYLASQRKIYGDPEYSLKKLEELIEAAEYWLKSRNDGLGWSLDARQISSIALAITLISIVRMKEKFPATWHIVPNALDLATEIQFSGVARCGKCREPIAGKIIRFDKFVSRLKEDGMSDALIPFIVMPLQTTPRAILKRLDSLDALPRKERWEFIVNGPSNLNNPRAVAKYVEGVLASETEKSKI